MTARTSIGWTAAERDLMRAWAARTDRPAVAAVDDALDRITTDPVGAVAAAQPLMGSAECATTPIPLVGEHSVRFRSAASALHAAYGGALAVAPVVRALVRATLRSAP